MHQRQRSVRTRTSRAQKLPFAYEYFIGIRKHRTAWIKITLFILRNGSENEEDHRVWQPCSRRQKAARKKNAPSRSCTHRHVNAFTWARRATYASAYDYNYTEVWWNKTLEWMKRCHEKCKMFRTHCVRISISFLSAALLRRFILHCIAVGCTWFWFAAGKNSSVLVPQRPKIYANCLSFIPNFHEFLGGVT